MFIAVQRQWIPGKQFRCIIDDVWWFGAITNWVPFSESLPESLFKCLQVRLGTNVNEMTSESAKMSPWDLEPTDKNCKPNELSGLCYVKSEELQSMLYQPKSDEWHGDRDEECRRIVIGLEEVMSLLIAEPFLLSNQSNILDYPTDLQTIKARFKNRFYRRLASAEFDVRYLVTNAEKLHGSNNRIVQNSRTNTDLLLRIIQRRNPQPSTSRTSTGNGRNKNEVLTAIQHGKQLIYTDQPEGLIRQSNKSTVSISKIDDDEDDEIYEESGSNEEEYKKNFKCTYRG